MTNICYRTGQLYTCWTTTHYDESQISLLFFLINFILCSLKGG